MNGLQARAPTLGYGAAQRDAKDACFQEFGFQVPQNTQLAAEPSLQPAEIGDFAPNTREGDGGAIVAK
jgi:hypothetical protein